MEINPEIIAFAGILLACVLRTMLPYLKKHIEGNGDITFSLKYIISFLSIVVVGFVATMLLFPTFTIPAGSELYIFIAAFVFAWASNDIVNRVFALKS